MALHDSATEAGTMRIEVKTADLPRWKPRISFDPTEFDEWESNYMQITLTRFEIEMAAMVGCHRQIEALLGKFQDNLSNGSLGWNEHVEGASAELALAKALGIYWDGSVNTFKRSDIGINIQVRSTTRPDGKLIIRPKDNPDDFYVLIRGKVPTFDIMGHIQGCKAMIDSYQFNPGAHSPAWFVPAEALRKNIRELLC